MELCGGACEDCGDQRRCLSDAARTESCVLRGEGRTGKGSGGCDGVGVSRRGVDALLDGCAKLGQRQTRRR